jgi:hypothetical protein
METIMSDEDQKMLLNFVRACADRNLSSFKRSSRNIEREFDQIVNGAKLIILGLENKLVDDYEC